MSEKHGITSALSSTGSGQAPAATGEVIGDLFDLMPDMVSDRRKGEDLVLEKRGPGRPAGSKNKRSTEWVNYLLSRHTSPLETLTALQDMSPAEIARVMITEVRSLSGDAEWVPGPDEAVGLIKDALAVKISAANNALPYLHERRGMVVSDKDGADIPVIALGAGYISGPASPEDLANPLMIDMRPADVVAKEKQALSAASEENSSPKNSSVDDKPL